MSQLQWQTAQSLRHAAFAVQMSTRLPLPTHHSRFKDISVTVTVAVTVPDSYTTRLSTGRVVFLRAVRSRSSPCPRIATPTSALRVEHICFGTPIIPPSTWLWFQVSWRTLTRSWTWPLTYSLGTRLTVASAIGLPVSKADQSPDGKREKERVKSCRQVGMALRVRISLRTLCVPTVSVMEWTS